MRNSTEAGGPQFVSSPRERRIVLAVVALALMMVVSAVSGLNVALPDLTTDTGASQSQVQWIVDAYTMVFAGLLLGAGALGDRYGRKGVLMAGLVIFGGAAAGALFVQTPEALIGLRAAMGVGAALVMPTTLSIITTSFPPEERARAVGVWVGMAGGGAVLGLLGAGILLEFFNWSSFFTLNVALATLALIGTVAVIPTSRDPQPPRLDPVGMTLSLLGVSGLVFGIIEGPERGWSDGLVVGGLATGAAALAAFVLWELRRDDPMLDPRLFRLRGFGTGSLSITIQFFASFGFFFIALQYLQYIAGLSPLQSALAMLPMPFIMIPLARRAPAVAARFGINRVGSAGLTLIAAGLFVLSFLAVDFHYAVFAGGLIVFATGMALASTPATTAIVSSLPAAKQGVASAVNDVSREFGSALGIALLGSVLNDRYRAGVHDALSGVSASIADKVESSIAFVTQVPADQLGPGGEQLKTAAEQSFVNATGVSMLVAAGILMLAAVYVAVRAPRGESAAVTAAHAGTPAPPAHGGATRHPRSAKASGISG